MSLSSKIIPADISFFAFVCVFMQGLKLLNTQRRFMFSVCVFMQGPKLLKRLDASKTIKASTGKCIS